MSSDKSYSAERQTGLLWNHLGPAPLGTGNGQRLTVYSTADQLVNATSDGNLTGLASPAGYIVAGAYRISGKLIGTQGPGSVTQAAGFTGPATSHVRISACWFANGGGAYTTGAAVISSLAGGISTPAFSTTVQNYWDFEGLVVFTAAGTLNMVGHAASGTNTWTAGSYSFLTLETVGQTS